MRNWGLKKSYKATSEWFNFDGNDNLVILIALHWLMDCWKILLFFRQLSVAKKAIIPPAQLIGRITPAEYRIMRKSSIARSVASIIALLILLVAKTMKLLLNYHPFLWELTNHYGDTLLQRAVWYAAFDVLFAKLLLLPFAIFGILLSLSSGLGVLMIFLASLMEIFFAAMFAAATMIFLILLTDTFGPALLFNTPIISNLVGLVAMAYYIEFIVPDMLVKVSTTNQQLKHQLEPIVNGVKFPIDRIYIDQNMSTAPNAYFVGVFGANMIAVTPALIKIMGERQVTAVVAHELGHWVHHHNSVQLLFSVVTVLCIGYGMFLAYGSSSIIQAFRFQDEPQQMIPVYLWITYGSSLMLDFIDGINSVVGCSCEYTADGFATTRGLGSQLKAALLTLAAKSRAFPLFDKWYSAWFLKHPTILDRIKRIRD